MDILTRIKMATTLISNATPKDWILAVVSLTPVLPCVIFIPKLIQKHKIRFNLRWFRLYDFKKHKALIREYYGYEII